MKRKRKKKRGSKKRKGLKFVSYGANDQVEF